MFETRQLTFIKEVRFRNNGLDAIEVQDNGSGIAPADYDTIALKHYTSKLSTYDDLSSLQTFGFRGEALSSLCALSHFHIITARPADGAKGTRLDFEQSGRLKGTSVVAAKQGTTVVVETLFHNLPVRRKELEKNAKREYSKVLALLNAYACVSVGVKFTVSNLMPKGKKMIAFSTNANSNTRDNISNVYGAKTISALIPLALDFELDPSPRPGVTRHAGTQTTQEDFNSRVVKIVGHISRPVVGEGRQTPDRQMFFVNSRPCNLPQIAKAFNEVYKAYNITQSPFIFADLKLDPNAYDVNVSPDKRTIMLHDQTALLENLKDSLAELFEKHDQSIPQAQFPRKKTSLAASNPPSAHDHVDVETAIVENSSGRNGVAGILAESVSRIEPRSPTNSLSETTLPGFVKASLIERFAGRDTEQRHDLPSARRRSSLLENVNTAEQPSDHASKTGLSKPQGNGSTRSRSRQESQSPLFEPKMSGSTLTSRSANQSSDATALNLDESRIPIIGPTPQKVSSQSTIQNAFDRMRPMRTPTQQATITIGDTTTISMVGSGYEPRSSKRARIHTPKFSLDGTPLTLTPKRTLFTKSFHALAEPGTQIGSSQEEGEGDEGNNTFDAPARSPSPHKRLTRKAFEIPQSDDIVESSNAPLHSPSHVENEPQGVVSSDAVILQSNEMDMDDEYIDESRKKAKEDARVAELIAKAEDATVRPTDMSLNRASRLFKVSQKKYWTINLERVIKTDSASIAKQLRKYHTTASTLEELSPVPNASLDIHLDRENSEEHLSLTIRKGDFNRLRIIGQFNRGFIVAVLPPTAVLSTYNLFIIDQHASDEKYNFERLSSTTELSSQRLVHPQVLELTAVEEEVVLANKHAITANGFVVDIATSDNGDDNTVGRRVKLTALPMSKDVTFTPTDLEELLALLLENPPSSSSTTSLHIPRPSKVRKLLASRACRSSVMVGKSLQIAQMESIVRHMGEMDKPWSCPHGRPTMRHLHQMDSKKNWNEGDGVIGLNERGKQTDWVKFLKRGT